MALDPIKLELHNAQFFGDVVTGTAAVRDIASVRRCTECLIEANVPEKAAEPILECPNCGRTTFRRKFRTRFNPGSKPHFQQIFYGNPYVDDFVGEPDIALGVGTQLACNRSQTSGHITEAFRLAIMSKTGFEFPMGEPVPDLHLTEDEKNLPPLIEGNYWIISTGKRPPFTSKFWPPERWQAVVSSLPDITFVQVGYDDGKPESEHFHPVLYGDNVINMIGETQDERSGIRELFKLVYHADGGCSLVSSLMHVLAGFRKPCVIPAGAREPARFELYSWHRFIHSQGAMKCEGVDLDGNERVDNGIRSCWRESARACPELDQGYPKCMMMIEPFQVANAIKSYYNGGALEQPKERARKRTARKPIFKMVCNAHAYGGGERSAVWIANRMLLEGYDVHLIPSRNVNREFSQDLSPYVLLDSQEHHLTEPCDVLMLYANDMTAVFDSRYKLLENVNAGRRIMVLNYRLFQAGEVEWSKHWDRYIFLCSDLEAEFKTKVPDCNSVILPPPVNLAPFLNADHGSRDKTMHIVRIGSQGDAKYPDNIRELVEKIKAVHPPVTFTFMGGHKSLDGLKYVDNLPAYSMPVADVLERGSAFWYILPDGYIDNGPRVIMEAMAAGLAVVADNRGGAKDRVVPGTGWLCDTQEQHLSIIGDLTGKVLEQAGRAAKKHAAENFDPEIWTKAILE